MADQATKPVAELIDDLAGKFQLDHECVDPTMQIVQGKNVCVVSCQRSPEPVFLKWQGAETTPSGDFFVPLEERSTLTSPRD